MGGTRAPPADVLLGAICVGTGALGSDLYSYSVYGFMPSFFLVDGVEAIPLSESFYWVFIGLLWLTPPGSIDLGSFPMWPTPQTLF